uniref:Uncharacterized protein n=1 Tax=Timema cristinae TaxID=61476 RepID=A0A7R9H1M1_TIMCR|nr:unnamed protein product [Timema cristinae]
MAQGNEWENSLGVEAVIPTSHYRGQQYLLQVLEQRFLLRGYPMMNYKPVNLRKQPSVRHNQASALYLPVLIRQYNTRVTALAHSVTEADLRKQARQLENEIDLKLVSFSKLGTGHGPPKLESEDTVLLLSGEHMFETMALEIEQLLAKPSAIFQPHLGTICIHPCPQESDTSCDAWTLTVPTCATWRYGTFYSAINYLWPTVSRYGFVCVCVLDLNAWVVKTLCLRGKDLEPSFVAGGLGSTSGVGNLVPGLCTVNHGPHQRYSFTGCIPGASDRRHSRVADQLDTPEVPRGGCDHGKPMKAYGFNGEPRCLPKQLISDREVPYLSWSTLRGGVLIFRSTSGD